MNTAHPNPLATGNAFQRAYHRWALPHYERIGAKDPALREHIEEIDLMLYTRKGVWAWTGWLLGAAGCALGLSAAGLPALKALVIAGVLWLALSLALLSTWLGARMQPQPPARWKTWRLAFGLAGVALAGCTGLWVGVSLARGRIDLANAVDVATRFGSGMALGMLGTLLLGLSVWHISRTTYRQRLERTQLQQERDAATAQALEADLRLLQAQIHPHFVFNTLATLQHWVDKRDERAGPLLRELTGFLRRSTEMLGRPTVPLAEELQAVRHYLAILQQRMGERLTWQVDSDPALNERPVPPGLLLTLVENAIEHGLEPKIGSGRLTVKAEALSSGWRLRVADDGLGLAPGSEDGVGLGNVRRRLQLQQGDAARLHLSAQPTGGTLAEVSFA